MSMKFFRREGPARVHRDLALHYGPLVRGYCKKNGAVYCLERASADGKVFSTSNRVFPGRP